MKLSDILRSQTLAIGRDWLAVMEAAGNEAMGLERGAMVDHLPEFLLGLADWIDGDEARAQRGFDALVEGHALQRLGFGIALRSLVEEYAMLRTVLLEHALAATLEGNLRRDLIRLNQGMDHAVHQAIVRYAGARDSTREIFIGVLGHDLRNPLTAITMATERMAKRGPASGDARDPVAVIQRAAARMRRMIDDLLELARARLGGGFPVVARDEDMALLCQHAIDELRLASAGRTLTFETLGDLRGRWDRDRVIQALSNLIANAIEHGADPIRLVARAEPLAVVTEISNMGAEIPADALRVLVDSAAPRSSTGQGLGLGLYIVREVVTAHGATLDVAFTPERGTTFTIRWPRAPAAL